MLATSIEYEQRHRNVWIAFVLKTLMTLITLGLLMDETGWLIQRAFSFPLIFGGARLLSSSSLYVCRHWFKKKETLAPSQSFFFFFLYFRCLWIAMEIDGLARRPVWAMTGNDGPGVCNGGVFSLSLSLSRSWITKAPAQMTQWTVVAVALFCFN